MVIRLYHTPVASEQIISKGAILNGRAALSDALQIPQGQQLLSNIRQNIQSPLDPVLASHRGWESSQK